MAGPLLMRRGARRAARELLPIDSEHNAIFQCLPRDDAAERAVRRILLTASGGPFRATPLEQLDARHAGAGLRASELGDGPQDLGRFGDDDEQGPRGDRGALAVRRARPSTSRCVIHPQSVVHSLVEYVDGSVIAQLGNPDMRTPIAHALALSRSASTRASRPLDLAALGDALVRAARPRSASRACALAYAALRARRHRAGGAQRGQRGRGARRSSPGALAFTAIAAVIEDDAGERVRAARPADSLDAGARGRRARARRTRRLRRAAVMARGAHEPRCITVVAFLVALGVLIVVHEFGHYLVARLCGVKVLRFSVGFGRPLLDAAARAATATEWVIAAIPLGGYVKMLDEREGAGGAAGGAPRLQPPERLAALRHRGRRARCPTSLSRSCSTRACSCTGCPRRGRCSASRRRARPRAAAGFARGDTVRAIDGEPVATWQDAALARAAGGAAARAAAPRDARSERGHLRDAHARPARASRPTTSTAMPWSASGCACTARRSRR